MSDELDERDVVTVFLRHDGDVLLLRRSDEVGSYPGRWSGVAGHVEDGDWTDEGDPDGGARREIREETGIDPDAETTLVRRGDSFIVTDRDLGVRWVVHPYLFEVATRAVEPNYETAEYEWVPPTEVLRRETVLDLWGSYDRVRPTVATVADDRDHGSAWISVRALETLRDEAALAAERDDEATDGWTALATTARALRDARPSMPVVANRVNRAMAAASDERTPRAVERAAAAGIERAFTADADAAARAAARLGSQVATLSCSGTVFSALREADPEAILVAESRPGREGVSAAERLASESGAAVTLTTDAAFPDRLAGDAETLLVGADAVLPDGRVLNKVGTRPAATVAAREGVTCLVVAASDKVMPAIEPDDANGDFDVDREERDPDDVYDGDADIGVANPTFDLTPAALVDAVVTEDGVLEVDDVRELAARHRERAGWDD